VPTAKASEDLTVSLGGPLPTSLDRSDLPERAADLLEWVWQETVRPYWPRPRRIMEADVVARTRQLSQGGWAAALADMRPRMRWLGQGRLQINTYKYPPRAWLATPAPSRGHHSQLDGVSCARATACVTVGSNQAATLAERWNGTTWAIQPIPNPT
jgi:hypothetical protein